MGAVLHKHERTAPVRSKSCTNNIHKLPPVIPENALADAAEIVRLAFPAPSEKACCLAAVRRCGASEGTWRSILRQQTKHPSFPLMMAALSVLFERKDIEPMQVPAIRRFIVGAIQK